MAKRQVRIWDATIPEDIRNFNIFGKSAHSWIGQSRGLHRAAEALIVNYAREYPHKTKDPYREPTALMLGGYAIETLLKTVIVWKYCDEDGFSLDSKHAQEFIPKTHDLKKLASMAKLRISKADVALLGQLSRYTFWGGRYPIPLNAAGYDGPAIFDHARKRLPPGKGQAWLGYQALYAKLHRLAVKKVFRDHLIKKSR